MVCKYASVSVTKINHKLANFEVVNYFIACNLWNSKPVTKANHKKRGKILKHYLPMASNEKRGSDWAKWERY
jgi:hypothetical protein